VEHHTKKMTFDITGKVHYEGIKNEGDTSKLLVYFDLASLSIVLLGGTKNKADAFDPDRNIKWTIKHKKGVKNGSFDWINTSKVSDVVGDTFAPFLEQIKEYRKLPQSQRSAVSFVKQVRKDFADLCCSVLDSFTAEQLVSFIQTQMIDANSQMMLALNDTVNRNLYVYQADKHPAVRYIELGYTPFLKGKAKGSRRLLFTDGVKEYDCGLRIRVTSNNGVTAFLGLSKANRNSQIVFKLQQDKVAKLLQEVNAQVYTY
jgi:hypothetical protein